MHRAGQHFPARKAPSPNLSAVLRAPEFSGGEQDHGEGRYRGARDYPMDTYAYLEYAEVESNAHNAAYYDAAEALDLK